VINTTTITIDHPHNNQASDIVIMDDNFASIVKAVLWGRYVRACVCVRATQSAG